MNLKDLFHQESFWTNVVSCMKLTEDDETHMDVKKKKHGSCLFSLENFCYCLSYLFSLIGTISQ